MQSRTNSSEKKQIKNQQKKSQAISSTEDQPINLVPKKSSKSSIENNTQNTQKKTVEKITFKEPSSIELPQSSSEHTSS